MFAKLLNEFTNPDSELRRLFGIKPKKKQILEEVATPLDPGTSTIETMEKMKDDIASKKEEVEAPEADEEEGEEEEEEEEEEAPEVEAAETAEAVHADEEEEGEEEEEAPEVEAVETVVPEAVEAVEADEEATIVNEATEIRSNNDSDN